MQYRRDSLGISVVELRVRHTRRSHHSTLRSALWRMLNVAEYSDFRLYGFESHDVGAEFLARIESAYILYRPYQAERRNRRAGHKRLRCMRSHRPVDWVRNHVDLANVRFDPLARTTEEHGYPHGSRDFRWSHERQKGRGTPRRARNCGKNAPTFSKECARRTKRTEGRCTPRRDRDDLRQRQLCWHRECCFVGPPGWRYLRKQLRRSPKGDVALMFSTRVVEAGDDLCERRWIDESVTTG